MASQMPVMRFTLVLTALLAGMACSRSPSYYLAKGNQFFAAGKYGDAAIQYRKALQKDPNSGEALYRAGLAEFHQSKFAPAYPFLLRAVDKAPGNDDAKAKLADDCLVLYLYTPEHPVVFYNQITKISDQLLAKNPSSFDGLRLKGKLEVMNRNPAAAIEYFEKANRVRPMDPDVTVTLTQVLFQNNQPQEAEKLALALIQSKPAYAPIYDVLSAEYRAQNRIADAEHILERRISNNPDQADYRLQLAAFYGSVQNIPAMKATLQPLLTDTKRFPEGALNVGDFYAATGNLPEAMRIFEDGARVHSGDNKLAYEKRIVNALLTQGNRQQAADRVREILKEKPTDIDARRVRASLQMESGKPEDIRAALDEFATLVKSAPEDPLVRLGYGRCLLAKGDVDQAQDQFREAVRARPDFIPALSDLAKINFQRKPADALGYAQSILRYQPNNLDAHQLAIDCLIELGRYPEAQTELALLTKQYPDNRNVQLQVGYFNLAQKKYKAAEQIFESVQKSDPSDARAAAGLAQVYVAQQQPDKAIQFLAEQLKVSPNAVAIRKLLADTALQAKKEDIAIPAYRELLGTQPKSAEICMRLGAAYEATGDVGQAITAYEQAKQLAPDQAPPLVFLATCQERVHRTEEAKANYRRALELQPDNAIAANNLAYLLAQDGGNLDEALKLVQRALQKAPGYRSYVDTLGYIYMKKKLDSSAIQTYSSLVRRYPKSPLYHYHFGMALLEVGDRAKAKTEFENALANQPSHDDEMQLRELLRRTGA